MNVCVIDHIQTIERADKDNSKDQKTMTKKTTITTTIIIKTLREVHSLSLSLSRYNKIIQ